MLSWYVMLLCYAVMLCFYVMLLCYVGMICCYSTQGLQNLINTIVLKTKVSKTLQIQCFWRLEASKPCKYNGFGAKPYKYDDFGAGRLQSHVNIMVLVPRSSQTLQI